jgi:neutral ceramidase
MELLKADRQDPPFVAMMSNGTSGNINNVNSGAPRPTNRRPYEQMRKVAHDVADEVVKVHQRIEYRDWVALHSAQKEITLGVRLPKPDEVERARGIIARSQAKGNKRDLQSLEQTYARETLDLVSYPKNVNLILQALRLGDLAITAVPCEVFVEIGLELKKRSPFPTAFTVSLANGYNGYLPTPEHHAIGGYETWRAKSSYLEVGASPKIVATLMELVGEVHER